jgi:hypothetical protein
MPAGSLCLALPMATDKVAVVTECVALQSHAARCEEVTWGPTRSLRPTHAAGRNRSGQRFRKGTTSGACQRVALLERVRSLLRPVSSLKAEVKRMRVWEIRDLIKPVMPWPSN